jgi:hypothetical protein
VPSPAPQAVRANIKFHGRTLRPPTPDEGVRGYTLNSETRTGRPVQSPLKPKSGLNGPPDSHFTEFLT